MSTPKRGRDSRLSCIQQLLEGMVYREQQRSRTDRTGAPSMVLSPAPPFATSDQEWEVSIGDQGQAGLSMGQAEGAEREQGVQEELLGVVSRFVATPRVGAPLEPRMAASINHLSNKPLQEKVLAQVLEEHTAPDNCEALKVKSLNPQIWGNVGRPIRTQEVKLQRILRLLTAAITAYARGVETVDMTSHQQDVLALMCTTQYELNNLRRDNIRPALNPKFAGLCKTPSVETDSFFIWEGLEQTAQRDGGGV